MKSKPYILWLVLGCIAAAGWLAWPSGRNAPARQRSESNAITSASPESSPAPLSASGSRAALPVPAVSPDVPGKVQPPLTQQLASGPNTSQTASATASPLYPGQSDAANPTAQVDVGRVRHMIGDYHTLMGENPVGTNAEIMKQMTGGNSRQATLGPPEGIPLNAQGELIDPWGSPYFFHQLSRDKMEVRSAGPDKVMWTADDVVAR